jgi:hypothetical protein
MYATIEQLKLLLPANITIGDTNLGTPYSPSNLAYPGMPAPIPGVPQNKDKLTVTQAKKYIHTAAQEIDSRLRPYYLVPLRRVKTFETKITQDISSGANVSVFVHDTGPFSQFDTVRVQDSYNTELVQISSIPSINQMILVNLQNSYEAGTYSLISIVEYPDPVPIICARLAVSYIYDELFAAEQSPSASQYGIEQRKLAFAGIDGMLDGTIKLFGQEHTGRRFIRGSLFDAYKSPVKDFSYGRDK